MSCVFWCSGVLTSYRSVEWKRVEQLVYFWTVEQTGINRKPKEQAVEILCNSFLLIITSFYLLIVGVEGFSCTWSHSLSRTHSVEVSGRVIRPLVRSVPDNTQHSQQTHTPMPLAGFEPAIPASERPQTPCAATEVGCTYEMWTVNDYKGNGCGLCQVISTYC